MGRMPIIIYTLDKCYNNLTFSYLSSTKISPSGEISYYINNLQI